MTTPTTPRGGGRRVAARGERRPLPGSRVLGPLGLVALAALAVLLTRTPDIGPGPAPAPAGLVDRVLLACTGAPAGVRGEVTAGLAPLPELGRAGSWRVGDGGSRETVPVPQRGVTRGLGAGTVLAAEGPAAAGAFASRTDTADRALAVASCAAPRAHWWFAGAGAALDHDSVLSLANVDPGPVVLDVRVLSTDGEVETVGTRGITLGPGETRDIPLGDVVPPNAELAVAVDATRGRVAAAMVDRVAADAAAPEGLEWLPSAPAPSRTVHLSGIPSGSREATLLVGNPSDLEAIVDLQVSGPRGTFTPTAARTVRVPPGSVVPVDATELFAGLDVAALRVGSQLPVLATLRSSNRTDHAYAAPVAPLTGPAVAPVVRGATTKLQLSAGRRGATVTVTAWSADGRELDTQRLEVDPAATVEVPLVRRAAYVLVGPERGAVSGSVTYAGSNGSLGVLPLAPLSVRVDLPVVVPGPR